MQDQNNLSPQQRSALESNYVFLSSVIPFLAGIDSRVEADEKLIAANLRELGYVCQQKLLEAKGWSSSEVLYWGGIGDDAAT